MTRQITTPGAGAPGASSKTTTKVTSALLACGVWGWASLLAARLRTQLRAVTR